MGIEKKDMLQVPFRSDKGWHHFARQIKQQFFLPFCLSIFIFQQFFCPLKNMLTIFLQKKANFFNKTFFLTGYFLGIYGIQIFPKTFPASICWDIVGI
jgi:hypothetical protein